MRLKRNTDMIRIGICEDLKVELDKEKSMVEEIMQELGYNVHIFCCGSGDELLYQIENKGDLDILLMDIEMNGKNGVETAKIIRDTDHRVIMIFISLYDQYCKELIDTQPFAFIDKPVSKEKLKNIMIKAIEVQNTGDEIFEFTFKKKKYCFPLRKICYFESSKRKIFVHSKERTDCYYDRLDIVEKVLEDATVKFLRINKSVLVNISYIMEYHYDYVVMYDGISVMIGKKYRDTVRSHCIENISKIYKV